MSRLLLWSGAAVLLLVLVLAAGLLFLVSSETALRWAWQTAEPMLPEGIEVASVEGRLIGPLEVRGVRVDMEGMRLRLDSAYVDWRPGDLVDLLLNIHSVRLSGLDYTALPVDKTEPDPPAEPFEIPDAVDLPIDIRLGEFLLTDARIHSAPDTEPFVVDRAELVASLAGDNWRISRLSARGPLFEIDGGARLRPSGRYANQAQFRWRFNAPDLAPLQGDTRLEGDLDRLRLNQVIAAPYNLKASAVVSDPLDALTLQASLALEATQTRAIRADLPPATLNVNAQAEGSLDDLGVQLDLRATETDYGAALIDLAARYTGEAVRIEQLLLTSPDTPARLQARGDVALAQGNRMDLVIDWEKLQWPLSGSADYASPAGRFQLTGQLDDYRLEGGLDWLLAAAAGAGAEGGPPAGRLDIAGEGNLSAFSLESLALTGAPGTLTGQADVTWAPALDLSATLTGENLNPGVFAPDWPGDIALDLKATARQQADGLHARLERLTAEGELRSQPLSLEARARHAPDSTVLETLALTAGTTVLTASGKILDRLDLRFDLDAPDLATTVPGAEGRLQASGQVSGRPERPRLSLQASGDELLFQGNLLETLRLQADLDATGQTPSDVALTLGNGQMGATQLDSLSLELQGTPADHALSLDVSAMQSELRLALTGGLPDSFERWRFTLNELYARYDELAPWDLQAPAEGLLSAETQQLEQACLGSGAARLCLQGSNDGDGANARFTLDDLDYAYAKPLLPSDPVITGSLSANGRVSLPADGSLDAQVELNTSAGTVTTQTQDGETVQVLALEPGLIALRMENDGLDASMSLPLSQGGGIQATAAVAPGEGALTGRPLTGGLDIEVQALDFISEITAEVESIRGALTGRMDLGGTLESPRVTGRTDLKTSQLALTTPGLDIKDLHLALVGRGETLDVTLDAKSGGGTLDVDGSVNVADRAQTVDLAIRGNRFKVIDNNEARAFATPDLTVVMRPERIDITGSVAVPVAEITPRNLPESGAVTVSSDQVMITPGVEAQTDGAGRALHARVRVIIGDPSVQVTEFVDRGRNYADVVRRIPGDKVVFEGFGLKSVLAGDLLVTQNPGKPALGTGELRVVVGQYKAYGQDLSIRNGRILFGGGPVAEPALNISAVRRPREEILVGIRVRGRLEAPKFTLFSEPSSMTQSEQLSWLVLGRPLSGASSSESSLVTRAALALGLKGGNVLTSRIGERLGVDELGLESGSTSTGAEQAALVIGKYLTPKLYVSYGIGLFEPISTLRMRYTLTERWQVETQSSSVGSGGDIIYTIERGQ